MASDAGNGSEMGSNTAQGSQYNKAAFNCFNERAKNDGKTGPDRTTRIDLGAQLQSGPDTTLFIQPAGRPDATSTCWETLTCRPNAK
jgi:hypothetical protein